MPETLTKDDVTTLEALDFEPNLGNEVACGNPQHDDPPPGKHNWWIHCGVSPACDPCHRMLVAALAQASGSEARCMLCGTPCTFDHTTAHYLGAI